MFGREAETVRLQDWGIVRGEHLRDEAVTDMKPVLKAGVMRFHITAVNPRI